MPYKLTISNDPLSPEPVVEVRYTKTSPSQTLRIPLRDYENMVADFLVLWSQTYPLGLAGHHAFSEMKAALESAESKAKTK